MENPATWTDAEYEVQRTLDAHHQREIEDPGYCGLSLTRQITDALRRRGLLAPAPWEKRPWENRRG